MSYVLVFKKGTSGGFGDRITGIMTVKSFAKIFNKNFKIIWDFDISKYFKDSIFEYKPNRTYRNIINMLNDGNHIKFYDILKNCQDNPFPNDREVYFMSNMTTSQFIYINPYYDLDYEKDMSEYYRDIYKNIFIPTDYLLDMVNKYKEYRLIGIQIRTGDIAFHSSYNPINDSDIEPYISGLASIINIEDRSIYITSDNMKTIDIAKRIFKDCNILYNKDAIQHIDKSKDVEKFVNVFVDHYILSNFAEELYISDYSNFGRTIALSSNCNKIFNIKGEPVCNKELLWSKKLKP